jgi:predicted nucleic acid-binding protein
MCKTKIVLDSDVIIHFMKGNSFSLLLDIFPEYQYLILDVVYAELAKSSQTKTLMDNVTHFMVQRIQRVDFIPSGSMMKEYALLLSHFGKGESAWFIANIITMCWEVVISKISKSIVSQRALLI